MYKNIVLSAVYPSCLLLGMNANAQDTDPNMGIIPAPVSVKKPSGEFVLSQQTVFLPTAPTTKR